MTNISRRQNAITQWVFDIFKAKAKFDLNKKYRIQTNTMINDYILDCSYFMTVLIRPSSVMSVANAQKNLHKTFNEYSINILGPQCMDIRKLTSRTRPFLPLSFLAIDIEGTRHNSFDVVTTNPHGHGIILFDEHTVFNFRSANSRFLCEDGSYEIVNPTREIALIKLDPFCSIGGVEKSIHYSLKYAAKLKDNQINVRPFDFYPPTSVNYPFWQYLGGAAPHSYGLETVGDDERNAFVRLWDVEETDRCVSRHVRCGKGGTTNWDSAI